MTTRAALYKRVNTGRQAEKDLSLPDQERQLRDYCRQKGWEVYRVYTEPGASARDDTRPEFQDMVATTRTKPPPFGVILS